MSYAIHLYFFFIETGNLIVFYVIYKSKNKQSFLFFSGVPVVGLFFLLDLFLPASNRVCAISDLNLKN